MPILARGPAFLQIGRDGFAHIDGHRQELLTPLAPSARTLGQS